MIPEMNTIYNGNCQEVLKTFDPDCMDSCVTDPPYGYSFMGKKWDYDIPSVETWQAIFRVLKPGAHMLVACGTRTQHRMAVNIEDAGFEIRDVITWHYGQGFPKSRNISKSIDEMAVAEREILSKIKIVSTETNTSDAKKWEGWGTALKPATEFWTLARKPLSEPNVASNVLGHGTGAINIKECRIENPDYEDRFHNQNSNRKTWEGGVTSGLKADHVQPMYSKDGRWPANLALDEFMASEMDKQSGVLVSAKSENPCNSQNGTWNGTIQKNRGPRGYDDSGGASRFFYVAKANQFERNKGVGKNTHPTVKPIELMRYLVRLITPKGGIVLDPFFGSGTTGIAAKLELKHYVGIELDPEYCEMSATRIASWNPDEYIEQEMFNK